MKIEVWSDIVCPFCYIGKRHLEKALTSFEGKDEVTIEWKSFQLNPDMQAHPGKSINDYIAEIKGISNESAEELNLNVTKMAIAVGLDYHLDKVVLANSNKAHRLIQLAKTKGLGNAAEEYFFKAYFCDGKDINDNTFLQLAGSAIGLNIEEIKKLLNTNLFAKEVLADIHEASQLGISGVPFFVIDRKYGISGAQPSEVFLSTFQKASTKPG